MNFWGMHFHKILIVLNSDCFHPSQIEISWILWYMSSTAYETIQWNTVMNYFDIFIAYYPATNWRFSSHTILEFSWHAKKACYVRCATSQTLCTNKDLDIPCYKPTYRTFSTEMNPEVRCRNLRIQGVPLTFFTLWELIIKHVGLKVSYY